MSLLNGSIFGDIFGKKIGTIKKEPSISEKFNMIFKNVEIEGKKEGFKRAAFEYKKAYILIENEYKQAEFLIQNKKEKYDNKSEKLILKLSELEEQEISLKEELERKTKDVSEKYGIPVNAVSSFSSFSSSGQNNFFMTTIDLIYSYKEKKLRKAEAEGYLEAKKIYEEKIEVMKKNLQDLKKNGDKEIDNLFDLICKVLEAIVEERIKIANLKILL